MTRSMMTRFPIYALFIGLLTTQGVQAQTSQNKTNAHASATLEVDSTTKGFLPPRMTTAQRNAISGPAKGLVIFNTNTDKFNYWDGSSWMPLEAGGSIALMDADSDTKIQVEESTNEDMIRFDVGGNERTVINNNGVGIKATPASSVDLAVNDVDTGLDGSAGRLDFKTNGLRKLTLTSTQLEVSNATLRLSGDSGRYTTFNAFNSSSGGGGSFLDVNLLNGAGENVMRIFRNTTNGVFEIFNNSTAPRLRFTSSNGRLTVIDLVETSDIRLKDNIMPLSGVLPKLMQLSGNRYTWRDQPDSGTQIGLLAQEVEAQFPELVTTNRNSDDMDGALEDTKAVSYTHFTAFLLEGIKELNQKVEALEARVAELERE